MRRFLLIGTAALLLQLTCAAQSAPSPLEAATVRDFVLYCQSDRSSCSDAVGLAFLQDSYQHSICFPNSKADYTLPAIAWLEGHPETAPMNRNSGILLALKTVYHC